ncbi:MAG: DUF4339 domain-containing protein [Akkermansiaceae bacterium]|nr:DUF4339 domain-containing protein [Verrucomicrobiales bacterium]
MYKIIGADQKPYGPVTGEQIRQWIAENRVNAQTQVQAEGTEEWKPLVAFSEFAAALGIDPTAPPTYATASAPQGVSIDELVGRDYNLSIGQCLSRGWQLLTGNFGLLFVGFLVYLAIEFGFGLLGAIPFIGPLFSLANLLIVGPLLGGIYYINLRAIRQQPATVGDVFHGFRTAFLDLFLGNLVPGLFLVLCFIPVVIVAVITMLPNFRNETDPSAAQIMIVIASALVCAIPMLILQTNWMFTLALVVDRRMSFWPAMQLSWKMVTKHWWQVFAMVIVVGLINIGGILLCCVGVLITAPLTIAAMMYVYEEIFGRRTA